MTKAPSAMHHLAAAASTNPRPAPKKMSRNTMFTRVAQITKRTFKHAHAMRKNPVVVQLRFDSGGEDDPYQYSS